MPKKSFTLIELIVVIAIIAILAAIIAPNAFRAIEKAKIARAAADFKTLKTATYTVYTDTGRWPMSPGLYSGISGFTNSVRLSWKEMLFYKNTFGWPGWDGPYLNRIYAKSPWGGYMELECSDRSLGHGPDLDLWLEYYGGRWDTPTRVPDHAALKLDQLYDDGNTTHLSGNMFYGAGDVSALAWVLIWDYLPVP